MLSLNLVAPEEEGSYQAEVIIGTAYQVMRGCIKAEVIGTSLHVMRGHNKANIIIGAAYQVMRGCIKAEVIIGSEGSYQS